MGAAPRSIGTMPAPTPTIRVRARPLPSRGVRKRSQPWTPASAPPLRAAPVRCWRPRRERAAPHRQPTGATTADSPRPARQPGTVRRDATSARLRTFAPHASMNCRTCLPVPPAVRPKASSQPRVATRKGLRSARVVGPCTFPARNPCTNPPIGRCAGRGRASASGFGGPPLAPRGNRRLPRAYGTTAPSRPFVDLRTPAVSWVALADPPSPEV